MSAHKSTTTRRGFIRLIGTAGCAALLAPALAKAGSSTGLNLQADAQAAKSAGTAGVAAKKRLCPCCEH